MAEHLLLLTGKLAEPALRRVMDAMEEKDFTYEVRNIGISVAALMTTTMIERRLPDAAGATRIILPGLCAGDVDALAAHYGVPVERGPADLKDLPAWLGGASVAPDLSRHDMVIFAEIVDAPHIGVEQILARARRYVADGADVIDLGCLPATPFPHLEEAVAALHGAGMRVSVDSVDREELRRGAAAGADYLLSLKESTLDLAEETDAVPILIPEKAGDMDSLARAIDRMLAAGRPFIADSILDPIHFGFVASIVRYASLRERYPDIDIMMGVGNLTELTDADTAGMNALLAGMMSELRIGYLLTTEVSQHACRAVRELDLARRMMYAARADGSLPKGYSNGLLALHEKRPYPYSPAEIAEWAAAVRDPNYRIQVSDEGIHVYNRDGLLLGKDPFSLFPSLKELEDDPPHAFYMGAELARAQIAWQLGKRYVQDEELDWGLAAREPSDSNAEKLMHTHKAEGTTMKARRERRKRGAGDS